MFVETTENGWEQFQELFQNKGNLWGSFYSIHFEDEHAYVEFTCGLLQGSVDSHGNWAIKDCHRIQATIYNCKIINFNLNCLDLISDPGYIGFDQKLFYIRSMDSIGFEVAIEGEKIEINQISRIKDAS